MDLFSLDRTITLRLDAACPSINVTGLCVRVSVSCGLLLENGARNALSMTNQKREGELRRVSVEEAAFFGCCLVLAVFCAECELLCVWCFKDNQNVLKATVLYSKVFIML